MIVSHNSEIVIIFNKYVSYISLFRDEGNGWF